MVKATRTSRWGLSGDFAYVPRDFADEISDLALKFDINHLRLKIKTQLSKNDAVIGFVTYSEMI